MQELQNVVTILCPVDTAMLLAAAGQCNNVAKGELRSAHGIQHLYMATVRMGVAGSGCIVRMGDQRRGLVVVRMENETRGIPCLRLRQT